MESSACYYWRVQNFGAALDLAAEGHVSDGLFIVFEGGEGSGKSTQAQRLCERLIREQFRAALIHEPGTTILGQYLRNYLKSKLPLTIDSELLLFAAARAQLVAENIRPSLAKGISIVADRFTGSTIAYQGFGRGIERGVIDYLNAYVTNGLTPDVTFLLDIDPDEGLRRVGAPQMQLPLNLEDPVGYGRADVEGHQRFEEQPKAFHRKVREGYLTLAQESPRWHKLDATQSQDEIAGEIWEIVLDLLTASSAEPSQTETQELLQYPK